MRAITGTEYLRGFALLAAINAACCLWQLPLSYHGGVRWDGEHYMGMTRALTPHGSVRDSNPYVYRVGLPWLVGHLFSRNALR